jgi:biopolymer transport protein TolQ
VEFEKTFWAGGNLHALYQNAGKDRASSGPLARIFEAGMGEFIKSRPPLRQPRQPGPGAVLDGARRAMRAAFQREMDALESHLAFLASVGSVSPYIGLLGTVWGIMNAFRGLANVQQATLAAVAPGIAEALIATAIGLFAAIPAFVAYNRSRTTSTVWRSASKASSKSSPTSCSVSRVKRTAYMARLSPAACAAAVAASSNPRSTSCPTST